MFPSLSSTARSRWTWLVLGALVCGCSSANEGDDKAPDGSQNPPVNGGDDGVGDVVQHEAGAPEVTKLLTATLRDGAFPTYLSPLIGNGTNHLFQNVTIKNPGNSRQTVVLTGALAGYTKTPAVATLNLDAGEEKSGGFDVTLDFDALSKVSAPVAANFTIQLATQDGKVLFAANKPTKVLPKNTVFWTNALNGSKPSAIGLGLSEAQIVASVFTTPHDGWGEVDKLLHEAATHSKNKAMVGYNHKPDSTLQDDIDGAADQVGAIWAALKARGFNYTDVPTAFFESSQNVRYPAESLRAKTGNCIDGTLVFSSALEAIGMEPFVNYVPGHAFVGVHIAPKGTPNYGKYIVVETTMLGTSDFNAATKEGLRKYDLYSKAGQLLQFEVSEGRAAGYLPSPFPMR